MARRTYDAGEWVCVLATAGFTQADFIICGSWLRILVYGKSVPGSVGVALPRSGRVSIANLQVEIDRALAHKASLAELTASERILGLGECRVGGVMSWDREFEEPVPLPRGRVLRTLRDAGEYVLKLPKAEASHPRWQNAADALRLVAEGRGPTMFARMAVMHAVNRNAPTPPLTGRKDRPWGRRPLKRDL